MKLKLIGIIMAEIITTSIMAKDIQLPLPDKTNTTNLIDFYSNQMWQDYDKNGLVRYNNRFRVLVDFENGDD